jgi:hypothetical protein
MSSFSVFHNPNLMRQIPIETFYKISDQYSSKVMKVKNGGV